jgi:hypothetical protein
MGSLPAGCGEAAVLPSPSFSISFPQTTNRKGSHRFSLPNTRAPHHTGNKRRTLARPPQTLPRTRPLLSFARFSVRTSQLGVGCSVPAPIATSWCAVLPSLRSGLVPPAELAMHPTCFWIYDPSPHTPHHTGNKRRSQSARPKKRVCTPNQRELPSLSNPPSPPTISTTPSQIPFLHNHSTGAVCAAPHTSCSLYSRFAPRPPAPPAASKLSPSSLPTCSNPSPHRR